MSQPKISFYVRGVGWQDLPNDKVAAPHRGGIHTPASDVRKPQQHHPRDTHQRSHSHARPYVAAQPEPKPQPKSQPQARPQPQKRDAVKKAKTRLRIQKREAAKLRQEFRHNAKQVTLVEKIKQKLILARNVSIASFVIAGAAYTAAMYPMSVDGRVAHDVAKIGIHPGVMTTAEFISQPTPDRIKKAPAISVVFGDYKQIPQHQEHVYHALREWASMTNPELQDQHALRKTYNFEALDKLDAATITAMPHFINGVKASIARDKNPLTNGSDKAAYAFLSELDKIRPEHQQAIAKTFVPLSGFSKQTNPALSAMYRTAMEGQSYSDKLADYKQELQTAYHYYLQTQTSFQKAKQSGLLDCMRLAAAITGVTPVEDQLTVSARETNLDSDKMWLKIKGQSANGPEQLVDNLIPNLLDEYGKKLLKEIRTYKEAHADMSENDRAWLGLSEYQLTHATPVKQLKQNYVLAFALNHLSLEHDRVGLVHSLTDKFHVSEGMITGYLSRPEQLSLINFFGLPRAEKMAAAYISYRQNPIPKNDIKLRSFMTPAILKRNHMSGDTGINEFFNKQIKPWVHMWVGFSWHVEREGSLAQQAPRPLAPSLG